MHRTKTDGGGEPRAQHDAGVVDCFNHHFFYGRFVELQRSVIGVGEMRMGLHHSRHHEVTLAVDHPRLWLQRRGRLGGACIVNGIALNDDRGVVAKIIGVAVK